jgi:hypothetical protein
MRVYRSFCMRRWHSMGLQLDEDISAREGIMDRVR